jgi:hypothetical protein
MGVAGLEPAGVEVEERDDEDGEQQRAVDARPVEYVGSGDEEDEVDGGGVCSATRAVSFSYADFLFRGTYRKKRMGIQLLRQNIFRTKARTKAVPSVLNKRRGKCLSACRARIGCSGDTKSFYWGL